MLQRRILEKGKKTKILVITNIHIKVRKKMLYCSTRLSKWSHITASIYNKILLLPIQNSLCL